MSAAAGNGGARALDGGPGAHQLALPGIAPVSLGERILRAETAALYALVSWQLAGLQP